MEEVSNNTQQNSTLYKDITKLWTKGWEAENDENNNRSKEAEECVFKK
ncbi:MAG: hypothetical protein LN560_03400 [Rickettsia endosymbiont of Sceptobius lativentris]|nr:hypothetical protein [Rickettsia endosymbiont of Sceptobius lativentris]